MSKSMKLKSFDGKIKMALSDIVFFQKKKKQRCIQMHIFLSGGDESVQVMTHTNQRRICTLCIDQRFLIFGV